MLLNENCTLNVQEQDDFLNLCILAAYE